MNCSNLSGPEHLLLAHHNLFQKVNGDVVIWWQIDADISGEEVVDFALRLVLGGELLGRDLGHLRLDLLNLVCWLGKWIHI